jgi:hypothetical protein
MSAAARRKISLAQKARWAKQNASGASETSKRTISLASRRKMACEMGQGEVAEEEDRVGVPTPSICISVPFT